MNSLRSDSIKQALAICLKGLPYRRVEGVRETETGNVLYFTPEIKAYKVAEVVLTEAIPTASPLVPLQPGAGWELWVDPQGLWYVFDRWYTSWSIHRTLLQEKETEPDRRFPLSRILEGLQHGLEQQLKSLGSKTRSQMNRIEAMGKLNET